MIEPYVTERQCSACHKCKPATEFGRSSRFPDGMSRRCFVCDRAAVRASRAKHARARKPKRPEPPTAWQLPADPRDFGQQLLAATQQRWRYECTPAANLTWIIGDAA